MINKVIILLLFLFLHLATSAEITSILLEHHNLDASEGQRLIIPCSFKVDDRGGDYQIELEWSVKPSGTDTFRPIIRLDDTGYLHVSEPNERAFINPMQVHKGHCSLVIDPVEVDDSGTYRVRMALNGIEKAGNEKVNIRVLKSPGTHDLHSKDPNTNRPVTTEVYNDPYLVRLQELFQVLKNKGYLLYLLIIGGVLLFLALLCPVAAIVLGCMCQGRQKIVKLKEEGRKSKKPPDYSYVVIYMDECNQPMNPTDAPALPLDTIHTAVMPKEGSMSMKPPQKPDVAIDMDRCNIPMKSTDATVLTLETAPTDEITKQGCMPIKPPEKQDVVIHMDGCNQLMQPIGAPDLSPETAPKAEMTKEGSMPMEPPEKADVVRDMDSCNIPIKPTDATVLPLETAPKAEMTKEGSMPMKPPEKADVVRDMDECKQLKQPTDETVLPLKTEPQSKMRKSWKLIFHWFRFRKYRYHPYPGRHKPKAKTDGKEWKRIFHRPTHSIGLSHPQLDRQLVLQEEEKTTEDTNLTDDEPLMAPSGWLPAINERERLAMNPISIPYKDFKEKPGKVKRKLRRKRSDEK